MVDVAKRAGVSQATVSLVMNAVPGMRISEGTRARVFEAAEALGYARGRRPLASVGPARAIGMLVEEVSTSPFTALAIDGAREQAWTRGCVLSVVSTGGQRPLEEAALDLLLAGATIGIIYAAILTREVSPPERLRGLPSVLLNCYAAGYPAVVPGHELGGRSATERLLQAGHRRIGFINGEPWMEAAEDRLRGYRQALEAAGIAFDPGLARAGGWQLSGGYEQTLVLMGLDPPPTAIFCASDRMAIGCYGALRDLRLRIPQDVSVVGFDDDTTARYLSPPLTTMMLPHEAMGRWAVERLLGPAPRARSPGKVTLECPLVERNSVAPPAA